MRRKRSWLTITTILICAIFQAACVKITGNLFDIEPASIAQLEETTSSGMVLSLAYVDYYREFKKWPDSFESLREHNRKKSISNLDSEKTYQKLRGFSNISEIRKTDKTIELKFMQAPFVHDGSVISGATGTIIINADCGNEAGCVTGSYRDVRTNNLRNAECKW